MSVKNFHRMLWNVLESFGEKCVVYKQCIEPSPREQPDKMLCDVVVPPFIDFVMVTARRLMQRFGVRDHGEIIEIFCQFLVIRRNFSSPFLVEWIKQK